MGTKKYLVKLTPYDKFFFGGERTFGQKADDKDVTTETNYFVKSNYFPQQTALLGFIRHQLLLQSENDIFKDDKIVNKGNAIDLIGESSFKISSGLPYGKIHSLSPIIICKTTDLNQHDFYFPANKEYQHYTKLDDDCKEEIVKVFLELDLHGGIPLLTKYNPKYVFSDFLVNKTGDLLKYDEDVFVEHKQVGIRKKYEGGTDLDAYYIQIYFKLKKDFSFAFIVELDEMVKFENQYLVVFGGEQQSFKMEVEDFEDDFHSLIPNYQPSKNFDKIILVSDAYVENNDVLNDSLFAITDTVDFRFLSTQTDISQNYYNKPLKSNKYNLFKKGSVFYGDLPSIENHFKNETFENLGYNIYKPIKKQ